MIETFSVLKRPFDGHITQIIELINMLSPHNEDIDQRMIRKAYNWYFGQDNILCCAKIVFNDIVGFGSLHMMQKLNYGISSVGLIEDVIIHPHHRGYGYGKEITEKLVELAKINKCYKVILNCSKDNVEFYEKMGFKESQVMMRKDLDNG